MTFICLTLVLTCIGCSKPATPTRPPAPPFKLPAAGDATDSQLRIGDEFPAIETVDLDANPVTFDHKLLGKRYTLLIFWSTWCAPCMGELPHEVELANRYEAAGLRVIGINADSSAKTAKAAAKENNVPWLNLFEGGDRTISNKLGIRQWPTLFLLDSDGKIVMSTPQLRTVTAEELPDGSVQPVSCLDWALRELLTGDVR
jgi:thiol-disulfide isomerase/thioredoxin